MYIKDNTYINVQYIVVVHIILKEVFSLRSTCATQNDITLICNA